MTRFRPVLSLLVLLFLGSVAPPRASAQDAAEPQLVVLISIDQLRGDLLEVFRPAFEGGLARLLDEGRVFPGASHAHAVTHTAAGHTSLATGVLPSRSGIVANSWDQRTAEGWQEGLYAVEDPASPIVGAPDAEGRSPRNLLRGGLGDWILAADPQAEVVSISGKDRAAITMAGRARGHVYWILPEQGRFVTSTWYRSSYPDWVQDYNDRVMPGLLADTVWENRVADDLRPLARADEGVPYENDGEHTVFPHRASQELDDPTDDVERWDWLLGQPSSDEAVLGLALRALDELELGRRGPVDYLGLSFSSTDYVGHSYGPFSQEQLDNLVRLDGHLERLFAALDEVVGEGRWVVGFSGDHGVMTIPEVMEERGEAGRRVIRSEYEELLGRALEDARGLAEGDDHALAVELARILEVRGLVADAYTHDELTHPAQADSFAVLYRNSHHPGRAHGPFSRFGVEVRFDYHELVSWPTGTTHGSPYWYDRSVPFVLFGAGVAPGLGASGVKTVDMAPSLAAIAGIPAPVDLDGRVLDGR